MDLLTVPGVLPWLFCETNETGWQMACVVESPFVSGF